ncbi:MAG: hypothetical protein ACRBDL_06745 [Alphaproteobacteria bacterium]
MTIPADDIYNYEQTTKELITSFGGEEVINKTIEDIADIYAKSIDPNGSYPDLSNQLAQAMTENPDFFDNVLNLGEVSNDNADSESSDGGGESQSANAQSVIDFVGEAARRFLGNATGDMVVFVLPLRLCERGYG